MIDTMMMGKTGHKFKIGLWKKKLFFKIKKFNIMMIDINAAHYDG